MMEVGVRGPLSNPVTTHSRLHSPAGPTPLMPNSTPASVSTYSWRASDSSQGTSSSTLFPPPPPPASSVSPVGSGPVEAANNVINKRGDKEGSLFMICLALTRRLRNVPGFADILHEQEQAADNDTDPVTLLWRTFRKGYPLMVIYNALGRDVLSEADLSKVSEKKRDQAATYKFLSACIHQLKFPSEECFVINDLYGDDTTGFVKVVNVIIRVLDLLIKNGIISDDGDSADGPDSSNVATTTKLTQRQHIIDELVKTERTYVKHLEVLQAFKKQVEENGVVTGDAVHDIFLNLNALLDFQRRFLIRVEQTNALPESKQNWGRLFVLYKEAFKVYEPYIANQKKCEETAMAEFEKLKEAGGADELRQMVESPTNLTSFLLKPFQRLAKYPLLLKELRDKGDLDQERRDDISTGIEAASSVLKRTNEAVDLEDRKEALEGLRSRVEDWKGHRIEGFGDLLLYGTFTVLKGDAPSAKDQEREYKIYLFEMILLCCKEINPNKQKNKLMSNKQLYDRKGKPKLQLKGRIFMQNVTDAVSTSKPGSYTCQIFWKGDPGIENFVIRFASEETLKKWAHQVDQQRRQFKETHRSSSSTKHSTTSTTEFTYLKDQVNLVNPYAESEDDPESATTVNGYHLGPAAYTFAQGDTPTTGRLRSATGGSGVHPLDTSSSSSSHFSDAASIHAAPLRPLVVEAPLTLRTQPVQVGHTSPGYPAPTGSYFSPNLDSPMSTRTNSSSGMFPFPPQPLPHGRDRFTAPAMARQASRDASATVSHAGDRGLAGRPAMPPHAATTSDINSQIRLRSASSPDIHNNAIAHRRAAAPGTIPNVPSLANRMPSSPPSIHREKQVLRTPGSEANLHFDISDTAAAARIDPRITPGSSRTATPASSFLDQHVNYAPSSDRPASPTLPAMQSDDIPMPSQLKVKVHCPSAGSTMTLVVGTNISFQSLKDRIDAKLQRSTNVSLSAGHVKLKYLDDEDYISMQSDDDVQMAFETWKEQQRDQLLNGQLGEIDIFCQK